MVYKFHCNSIDGQSKQKYGTLMEFELDWTGGRARPFDHGCYVTPDGITMIYPDNDATLEAVQRRYKAVHEMENNPISPHQKEIFQALDVSEFTLELLQLSGDKELMIDTGDAQTRLVKEERYNVLKAQMAQTGDDVHPRGLIVAHDKLTKNVLILDMYKSDQSLEDLFNGKCVKGLKMDVLNELCEGFNDDGVYADSSISGDVSVMRMAVKKVNDLANDNENVFISYSGRSNTRENPMHEYSLKSSLSDLSSKGLTEDVKNNITGDVRVNIPLNEKSLTALGSTSNGLYIKQGNDVLFVEKGKNLMLDTEKVIVSVHDNELSSDYSKIKDDWLTNGISM